MSIPKESCRRGTYHPEPQATKHHFYQSWPDLLLNAAWECAGWETLSGHLWKITLPQCTLPCLPTYTVHWNSAQGHVTTTSSQSVRSRSHSSMQFLKPSFPYWALKISDLDTPISHKEPTSHNHLWISTHTSTRTVGLSTAGSGLCGLIFLNKQPTFASGWFSLSTSCS